nr:hypothetical protein [Tanacetum cinerariifolium]
MNILKEGVKSSLTDKLVYIDKELDNGVISDDMLLNRLELSHKLYELNQSNLKDAAQKAKLAIRGVFDNDVWLTDPPLVKNSFLNHFATRFKQPASSRLKLNMSFPNRLTSDQIDDLERNITRDEIKAAVWDCGENKSPSPDGFAFVFFRHFWDLIGSDLCTAVNCFFDSGLIGSVYKVVTKILANRLSMVISDLISNTQSAFVKNRQILDGLFILNEALAWCKSKKKQALMFKVDFAKAWCSWIRGIFSSNMASILVNGSPTSEFLISCSLKQGDPLAPLLFILVMETQHITVSRYVHDGVFKGLLINVSMVLSHLLYADDVVFVGEWPDDNLANLVRILQCFQLASGLKINMQKSQVMGVGVTVRNHMSRHSAWSTIIQKIRSRLSIWKAKTLFIGGRLTLLKSILGAVSLYTMSIYKAPKGVLHEMEMIRNKFFVRADSTVWRFISQDGSLWSRVINAIYGSSIESHAPNLSSCWNSILREVHTLALKGFNFLSHCKIRVGNGLNTILWLDTWISDLPLSMRFPRIFALERTKAVFVAVKRGASSFNASIRRQIRDAVESHQWSELNSLLSSFIFSPSSDRWSSDLKGEGMFCVKDSCLVLDDLFLPSSNEATRWAKYVSIKVNVFAWRARLDRLPTRDNLAKKELSWIHPHVRFVVFP